MAPLRSAGQLRGDRADAFPRNFLLSRGNLLAFIILHLVSPSSSLRPAVLVTGSTDGIGVTTAKHLGARGFDVLLHGRDTHRIENARGTVQRFVNEEGSDGGRISTLSPFDISTVDSCMKMADEVQMLCSENDLRLTVLMNNAGVYSEQLETTADGLEMTFAVNVLAPFVLTSMLLPTLLASQPSRIVIASSISQCQMIRDWDDIHKYRARTFSSHGTYSDSKLLDAMLAMEFADRLQDAGIGPREISCNCLDPGTVNTKMLLAGWGPCGIEVEDALDQTWLCSSKEVDGVSGKYFVYKSERRAGRSAYDPADRQSMWSLLSQLAPAAASMWNFSWKQ